MVILDVVIVGAFVVPVDGVLGGKATSSAGPFAFFSRVRPHGWPDASFDDSVKGIRFLAIVLQEPTMCLPSSLKAWFTLQLA